MTEYIPLVFMTVFAFVMAGVFALASEWLGAKRRTSEKSSTYESGMRPFGNARQRFTVKFYMVAVSFVVFDIEAVFLYPWASRIDGLPLSAFLTGLFFIVVLFAGYLYELLKGGFDWD